MHPYLAAERPHLFGHRGASGEAPENTLPAFELALAQGMGFLEMDCHATLDGEIVILHDPVVDRISDGSGPIRELRFAEVEKLDAGYHFSPDGRHHPFRGRGVRIPRLEEVLEAFPEARINLEIKQAEPPIAAEVLDRVRCADAGPRVLLAAAEEPIMQALHALQPETAIGSSIQDVRDFFQAFHQGSIESFRVRGHALQIPPRVGGQTLVSAESVRAAQRVGLAVHVWTINDPREMRELLGLGVDGIMTDFPRRLRAIVGR
ncbi:MAG: glycerophosphodiester phosphodiesterase [Myxococcota bacterium]